MTQRYEVEIKNLTYKNERYESGKLSINEETSVIEFMQNKRSFLSTKTVPLTQLSYTPQTIFSVQGSQVKIDAISFEVTNLDSLNTITEMVTKPYWRERNRRERLIRDAEISVRNFLYERAKAFEDLSNLVMNPRESLLKIKGLKVDHDEDVIQSLRRRNSDMMVKPYTDMESSINTLKDNVKEENIQKMLAIIYGIGSVQKAMLIKDDDLLRKSFNLLEKASSKKLNIEQYKELKIINMTEKLYNELNIMTVKSLDL